MPGVWGLCCSGLRESTRVEASVRLRGHHAMNAEDRAMFDALGWDGVHKMLPTPAMCYPDSKTTREDDSK